jgi:ABC-type nitrate/sulfonate/bicarbonate transport system substrate-binding protein
MLQEAQKNKIIGRWLRGLLLLFVIPSGAAAQKELPQVTIAAAVPGWGFAAVWVAEQLQYFEKQGVRAKISIAGGGSPCFSAVVARSVNFCASSSEGLILSRMEGAPVMAVQVHMGNMTVSVAIRNDIVQKAKLTRESPLKERLQLLTQLKTIGATSPGAISEQIFKFLVKKTGGNPDRLKFAYLGATELPAALMNNIIDAAALTPPAMEATEAAGKGYVLIPLGRGEIPELTDYPYAVLTARPDFAESNAALTSATSRAISQAGALFHSDLPAARAALRAHRLFNPQKVSDDVFDLSLSLIKDAVPRWGDMSEAGWQKVINFSTGAGIIKDPSKVPAAKEGVLWTNKYVGRAP